MCSRVEPSPPWLPSSQTAPNFSPLSTSTLTVSLSPTSETHPTQDLGFASTREYFSFSLAPSLSLSFSPPSLFLSRSLSMLGIFLSFRFYARIPAVLFVFRSFAFLFPVRSLFVLEIRSGLPNPLFSCAVINYYLLAIHPRAHRTSCTGKLNHFYGTLYSRRFFLPAI